jgi:hypothetical protein
MLKKYEFTDREEFARVYNSIGETEVKESFFDEEGYLIPTVLLEKTSHKPIILGYMEIGYNDVVKQITETIQVVSLDEEEQETYTDEEVIKDVTVREYIFSDKFCVDIFWKDYEDESVLSLYEVFPKHPKHTIS